MEIKEKIQQAYIEYVLINGREPNSVFVFAKDNDMAEQDFYEYYSSFESIDAGIWNDLFVTTIEQAKQQEIWQQYSAREKMLSFFYSFFELLKSKRSYVNFSMNHFAKGLSTPAALKKARETFDSFSKELINEGIASAELVDRKFISERYKDALWAQLSFVLKFWQKDTSTSFEKTDEAIEKGVNVSFDLFQKTPIDNLFEYGKFLTQNMFK